ncbi:MAG: YkgJ family cysteine cluster protein [Planctomycetes bacterium]|nr:YkgJ family cysteine cluster protein [Planctomycetota bacterium]
MTPQRVAGFPFTFACRRSGNCCAIPGGFVRVTADEAQSIAAHLGLEPAVFARRYLRPDGERLVDGLGSRCVFLRDGAEAGCSIYPVRPAKCRTWPFWPEVLADPALRRLVERTCPGIEPLAQD